MICGLEKRDVARFRRLVRSASAPRERSPTASNQGWLRAPARDLYGLWATGDRSGRGDRGGLRGVTVHANNAEITVPVNNPVRISKKPGTYRRDALIPERRIAKFMGTGSESLERS